MCGIKQLWPQGFGRQFPGRGSAIRFAGWCGSPGFCVDLALIGEESIHALDHLTAVCTLFDRVRSKNLRRAWCRGLIVVAPTALVPASMASLLTVTAEFEPLTTSVPAAYRGGAA
jgi:hypothetical protein